MVIDGISAVKKVKPVGGFTTEPRSVMPTPSGPVMKAWARPLAVVGLPHHLPRVVDPVSGARVSTECAEIGHACAIRARDKGMGLPVVSLGVPYHLPRVVDPVSPAIASTECAEIGHACAIRARDEGMGRPGPVSKCPGCPLPPAPRR